MTARLTGRDLNAIKERCARYEGMADRLDGGKLPGLSESATATALGLAASLTAADVPDLIVEVERLLDEATALDVDRESWRQERNKLARECADLRDEANTARTAERERIADWFKTEADVWRINRCTSDECEYDWAAQMVRDLGGES